MDKPEEQIGPSPDLGGRQAGDRGGARLRRFRFLDLRPRRCYRDTIDLRGLGARRGGLGSGGAVPAEGAHAEHEERSTASLGRRAVPLITPSLLDCDFARVGQEIAALEAAGVVALHLDVMDGHFVPNLSYGPPVIADWRKVTDLALRGPPDDLQPRRVPRRLRRGRRRQHPHADRGRRQSGRSAHPDPRPRLPRRPGDQPADPLVGRRAVPGPRSIRSW